MKITATDQDGGGSLVGQTYEELVDTFDFDIHVPAKIGQPSIFCSKGAQHKPPKVNSK